MKKIEEKIEDGGTGGCVAVTRLFVTNPPPPTLLKSGRGGCVRDSWNRGITKKEVSGKNKSLKIWDWGLLEGDWGFHENRGNSN